MSPRIPTNTNIPSLGTEVNQPDNGIKKEEGQFQSKSVHEVQASPQLPKSESISQESDHVKDRNITKVDDQEIFLKQADPLKPLSNEQERNQLTETLESMHKTAYERINHYNPQINQLHDTQDISKKKFDDLRSIIVKAQNTAVSYTHLTLPTIYSV